MNRITAAILLASLAALAAQTAVVTRTGFLMGDFRAFYCAARVTAQGENPYLAQPLRTCEIGVGRNLFFRKNPGVTIPAPLQGMCWRRSCRSARCRSFLRRRSGRYSCSARAPRAS